MSRPRVLLVEDDASIRRFVEMVVEDLPVSLVGCDTVAEAVRTLRAAPVALVITDLMLPGESGLGLLQRLADEPALAGRARVAVFSAGLNPAMRERLAAFSVWRFLSKPASVEALRACVIDALGAAIDAAGPEAGLPGWREESAASQTVGAVPAGVAPAAGQGNPDEPDGGPALHAAADAVAIARHFGGNAPLFQAFKASCLAQFPLDVSAGDAACALRDAQSLRRVAHSLKSVLLSLGQDEASELARRLEDEAALGTSPQALSLWHRLRNVLQSAHGA